MRRSRVVVAALLVALAGCSAGTPTPLPETETTHVAAGRLEIRVPIEPEAGKLRSLDPAAIDAYADECTARNATLHDQPAGAFAAACREAATLWQHPSRPKSGDPGSRLMWETQVDQVACITKHVTNMAEFPPFDHWVRDGGFDTALNTVAGHTDLQPTSGYVPDCPTGTPYVVRDVVTYPEGTDIDPAGTLRGTVTYADGCLLLITPDQGTWLPAFQPGTGALLFARPGTITVELFDQTGIDQALATGQRLEEIYTYIWPTHRLTLPGQPTSNAPDLLIDTQGCDGWPVWLVTPMQPSGRP